MLNWQGLAGQDRVVALLGHAIARGRVPHAYLFSGPPGAALVDVATWLAGALNCDRGRSIERVRSASLPQPEEAPGGDRSGTGPEPCGECEPCTKILGGFHPDVVTLRREGAAQIVPIERVREQVIARLGLPPHEADVRVFVVEEATALAPPAANAMLKTLEEPPARTLFVLCTTAPEQLLPTIRSRCQRVRFGGGAPVGDADPARAERVARLADELAADRHELTLPNRVAEVKGDAAPVLVATALRLHARARDAAARADVDTARRAARRATAVLAWHTAVAVHNANPQLAIEALIGRLGQDPP